MNILFPIAEVSPIYKIGGLGDVGGSLPPQLNLLDADVRVILPKHPEIILDNPPLKEASFTITYDHQELAITIYRTLIPKTTTIAYLVEESTYLSQHTDASDNHADKFAVFSSAVAAFIAHQSPYWQPHIIHCHDWHTALIPVLLKHTYPHITAKTIITIHNLAYQGITTTPVAEKLQLDPKQCQILSWDNQDGDTNILLEGLLHSDIISTVSPNYAKEILTETYGEKIHPILETKKSKIIGIINGIDTTFFNPESDPLLTHRYTTKNWETGKRQNREAIYHHLNLSHNPDDILISFIGRVDPYQKGIGLIIEAINQRLLPPEMVKLIFLGTGDPQLEQQLHQAATNNPNVTIITRFDEPLAHQLYAASQLCLIPSRFEPCGLVQLIAMRYGSLPIARATGGLTDTIKPHHNGFLFEKYASDAMMSEVNTAINACRQPETYKNLVNQAMNEDFSWSKPAKQYINLYHSLITNTKKAFNKHY